MNKLIVILLSFLILFQSMQLKPVDLLSIGKLLEHAQMHLNEGKSIVQFYEMHFGKDAAEHLPKDQKHKDLPFHQTSDVSASFWCLCNKNFLTEVDYIFISMKESLFYYINNYSFLNQNIIVQPPIF